MQIDSIQQHRHEIAKQRYKFQRKLGKRVKTKLKQQNGIISYFIFVFILLLFYFFSIQFFIYWTAVLIQYLILFHMQSKKKSCVYITRIFIICDK